MGNAGRVFRALADPTRRQILQELKGGERPAGEIASLFEISGPSISRHLAILKSAELVRERRVGNRILYRIEPAEIVSCLGDFLARVCPTEVRQRKRIEARKRSDK